MTAGLCFRSRHDDTFQRRGDVGRLIALHLLAGHWRVKWQVKLVFAARVLFDDMNRIKATGTKYFILEYDLPHSLANDWPIEAGYSTSVPTLNRQIKILSLLQCTAFVDDLIPKIPASPVAGAFVLHRRIIFREVGNRSHSRKKVLNDHVPQMIQRFPWICKGANLTKSKSRKVLKQYTYLSSENPFPGMLQGDTKQSFPLGDTFRIDD
jgi:hypothetical protein